MPHVTEKELVAMGLTPDPFDPTTLIRVDQAAGRRPDESWTTEQLQAYAVAGARHGKALLGQVRELRQHIDALVRQTAYERWWTGCALHLIQNRLKADKEWTNWQRQEGISRSTVFRAIRLHEAYPDPEAIRGLPITEVYRMLDLCPTKEAGSSGRAQGGGEWTSNSDDEEEENAPIMIKHRGCSIIANSPKEAVRAVEAIKKLPESCKGKTIDIVTAERRARRNVRRKEIEGQVVPPRSDDDIRIYHCRFQELATVAGIEPGTVPFIFADIPYGGDFLPEVSDVGQVASELLAPGGLLAIQTGTYYFQETTRRLREHLKPVTFGITVWEGDANPIQPLQCTSHFKPVWLYSKGVWQPLRRWNDVSVVHTKEKDLHEWQQPLEDAEHWLLALTNIGDLVVDLCGGMFTMGVACHLHHRRYIGCDCDEVAVIEGQARLEKYRNADPPFDGQEITQWSARQSVLEGKA